LTTILYLLVSTSLLIVMGAGLARTLSRSALSRVGSSGLAYGLGALSLTAAAIVYSMIGIPWSVAALGVPLAAVSAFLLWRRRGRAESPRNLPPLRAAAGVLGALAAGYFALTLVNSAAASVDFVLIYGVKAVTFAMARSMAPDVLRHVLFVHGAPRYPPLMAIVEAWGVLVAGDMPWRFGPAISLFWFLATVAAVGSRLRRRIGADEGAAVCAYWACAIAMSFTFSYSGGNGEAPLVFYLSVAGAWLLTETPGESRFLPAVLLAGAALTKQEGLLSSLALAIGVLARDLFRKHPRPFARAIVLLGAPVAAVVLWFGYEKVAHLPVGYQPPARVSEADLRLLPAIFPDMVRHLAAGTYGLSWTLPLLCLVRRARRWTIALPALVLCAAVFGALFVTYLSPLSIDPAVAIARTLPRAAQPALSLLILGAGVVWFRPTGDPGPEP
jgi:hypothetical protein